ncbi:hypothetical protein ElyMa_000532900 [Elysia marginata]|uniref:Uncharacterized protein n=1 Tax=Elysia marginata TaxID=1093978 RepID=A0AAV4FY83_9GAST|nr:hypothetical protein ElyMa_000532900 [Elysia marginata]
MFMVLFVTAVVVVVVQRITAAAAVAELIVEADTLRNQELLTDFQDRLYRTALRLLSCDTGGRYMPVYAGIYRYYAVTRDTAATPYAV